MFRKTRHENLVLFMGACMKPPRLAIVTSMCKGMTLYTHIHLYKDKFNVNNTTIVAQQISQVSFVSMKHFVFKWIKQFFFFFFFPLFNLFVRQLVSWVKIKLLTRINIKLKYLFVETCRPWPSPGLNHILLKLCFFAKSWRWPRPKSFDK